MAEFLDALREHAFLRAAVLAGLLSSVACGVVGSYVATRRISYIAGGVAHCVLGGIGMAGYLRVVWGWTWIAPLHGALAAALAAALLIGLVSLRARQREDTVIGALWAVGMAVGLLFIARTPGYNQDLNSYLFGNILLVPPGDLWWIAVLDVFVVLLTALFYRQLLAVCFDEEYARTRGVNVEFYYLALLCLTALAVVALSLLVGIVLVIALITLPAGTASLFARTMKQLMALSSLLCALFIIAGLALSYAPDLPCGPTIVLLAGIGYLAAILVVHGCRRAPAAAFGRTVPPKTST